MMGIEITLICEGCLRTVDLRTDEPDELVGWQVTDVRDGATFDDVSIFDLQLRCPGCKLPRPTS